MFITYWFSDICLTVVVGDFFAEYSILLTLSEFCLRHISVMVYDIRCVGTCIDEDLN